MRPDCAEPDTDAKANGDSYTIRLRRRQLVRDRKPYVRNVIANADRKSNAHSNSDGDTDTGGSIHWFDTAGGFGRRQLYHDGQ
jgi:hypothetical protein